MNKNIMPATTARIDPNINGALGFIADHKSPAIKEEKKVQTPIIVWYAPNDVAITSRLAIRLIYALLMPSDKAI